MGEVTRPRRRPDALLADRGYDHDRFRRLLQQRGIRPVVAKRGEPHGTVLGIFHRVVERTIAWRHGFRGLRSRWERRDDIHGSIPRPRRRPDHPPRHVQRPCQDLLE
ncbi:transposase [Streptomyces sp. SID5477]|nr:transposase [Streptomyces sp. SID5477]